MTATENKASSILVVDDESSLTEVLAEVLGNHGHRVVTASSGEEALILFRKDPFPLVFTDIRMPGMTGTELLKEIKGLHPSTEVIIMTAYASLDTSLIALREGAYDYLIKPFENLELITTMTHRVLEKIELVKENHRLLEELKSQNQVLERSNKILRDLSIRDGLTGLYNHRYFQESLGRAAQRFRRYGQTFSVMMIDINGFKYYNDTCGHLAGDHLLTALARILDDSARETDIIARYGGDEFVMLLPETTAEQAGMISARLTRTIAHTSFAQDESAELAPVSVSIGVANCPLHGTSGDTLLHEADASMYAAKRAGNEASPQPFLG